MENNNTSNPFNIPSFNAEGAHNRPAPDAGNEGNTAQQAGIHLNAGGTYTPHISDDQHGRPVDAIFTVMDSATSSATVQAQPAKQADLHILTTQLSADKLKEAADVLAQRRATWEAGALKSSNAELIALLADCLGLYLHLIKFDETRRQFHALYKASQLKSTKGTELMTKVVRYVFGDKAEKRVFAYAKVLTVAYEKSVTPETLAAFVSEHGGVEEVRRTGGNADEKRKMRDESVEKARAALKIIAPLAAKVVPLKSLKVEGLTNFVAAIARREGDGTFSVVHFSTNEVLIQSLLANAAKDVVKSEKSAKTDAYVAGRQ